MSPFVKSPILWTTARIIRQHGAGPGPTPGAPLPVSTCVAPARSPPTQTCRSCQGHVQPPARSRFRKMGHPPRRSGNPRQASRVGSRHITHSPRPMPSPWLPHPLFGHTACARRCIDESFLRPRLELLATSSKRNKPNLLSLRRGGCRSHAWVML